MVASGGMHVWGGKQREAGIGKQAEGYSWRDAIGGCKWRVASRGLQVEGCKWRVASRGMQAEVCKQRYASIGMQA